MEGSPRMKKSLLVSAVLASFLGSNQAHAEIGIESDTVPFLNKGYHGSVWYGSAGKRIRLVYAKATFPDAFTPDGFSNLTSRFKEMEFDFFIGKRREEFLGPWIAIGGGRTDMSIQSSTTGATATITSNDLHSGIGYAIPVTEGFYINPWIGVDIHLNALEKVQVGNETWNPRKADLVGGMKLGIKF